MSNEKNVQLHDDGKFIDCENFLNKYNAISKGFMLYHHT